MAEDGRLSEMAKSLACDSFRHGLKIALDGLESGHIISSDLQSIENAFQKGFSEELLCESPKPESAGLPGEDGYEI